MSGLFSVFVRMLLAGVVCVLPATPSVAATATVGPIQISIPAGFEYAQSERQGNLQISAWTKSPPAGSTKALLQVTIYDFGSRLDGAPSAKDLADGAEKYLREFLSEVERRRTDYALSPVEQLKLADLPAARATWTGLIADIPAVGVMYCVIVQQRFVVSFHTQDVGVTPTDAMREAMKAIEAAKVVSISSAADTGHAART